MTHTMTAITIEGGKGPASALKPTTVDRPTPGPGEILVKVHAAGLNWPDIGQRMGSYPVPAGASPYMGLEVAGVVVEAAGRWKAGDRVCALLTGGGYAEYVAVDARQVLPVPDHMDLMQAAGLPETVFTVWANVFEDGRLKAGETLLTHGANSGIGATAIQMGKAAGARVIATARSAEKARQALALGADVVVDTSVEDFAEVVAREGGCDVVCETVGGETLVKALGVMKPGGRIAIISLLGGDTAQMPLRPLMSKRLQITGSTLRSRSTEEKVRLTAEIERHAWSWAHEGKLTPRIDRVFPLAEAAAAQAYFEARTHSGKVMLLCD